MKAYDLLIFDWDGTLINSIERILFCFRRSFETLALPAPADAEVKQLIGLPLAESFRILFPRATGEVLERLNDAYRRIWRSADLATSPLFPGVRPMLMRLRAAGFLLAVATGKSREGLTREMEEHRLTDWFQGSRCARENKAKPDPEMLRELLEETGTEPRRALMIGDSSLDLEMAAAMAMDRIAVSSGSQNPEVLAKSGPLACFPVVTHLEAWLEQTAGRAEAPT